VTAASWPIAPVHIRPLKSASRRLRPVRQQPRRPMTGRETRRHGLRTPPAPTTRDEWTYGPMPADRFHIAHGRAVTVCDRLERTTHQDVAANHQQHVAQISDPFDWLVIDQVVPRNPARLSRCADRATPRASTKLLCSTRRQHIQLGALIGMPSDWPHRNYRQRELSIAIKIAFRRTLN